MKLSVCVVLCGAALSLQAQIDTNKTQSLSLQQAVQMAVEHNLDVQVQRYVPMIDKYAIEANYGVYDVYFNGTAKNSYNNRAGSFGTSTGLQNPSTETASHIATAGLGGDGGGNAVTPWGMQYALTSNFEQDKVRSTPPFFGPSILHQDTAFAGLTLDQPLLKNLWTDVNRYNIQYAKKTYQYDELGFRQQVITVVSQTEQAYYELIYAFDKVKVEQMAVELAQQLVSENKRRVEVGTLAPLDEKQSESQLAGTQADLLAAQEALSEQENTLKSLITDRFRDQHDVRIMPAEHLLALPETFDRQQSWERGLKLRPDVAQARVDMERQGLTIRYRHNQLFPSLDLVGSYGRSGAKGKMEGALGDIRDENFPSYSYGIALSVPLSNKSARSNYKSAKAANEQAALVYKRTEQNMLIQIENSINSANNLYARIQATRAAREFSEEALQAEQKKLAVGKSTSFIVLQLQNTLTASRSAEIRALADYNEALSKLAANEGYTLDKYHLSIKLQ